MSGGQMNATTANLPTRPTGPVPFYSLDPDTTATTSIPLTSDETFSLRVGKQAS